MHRLRAEQSSKSHSPFSFILPVRSIPGIDVAKEQKLLAFSSFLCTIPRNFRRAQSGDIDTEEVDRASCM